MSVARNIRRAGWQITGRARGRTMRYDRPPSVYDILARNRDWGQFLRAAKRYNKLTGKQRV